MTAAEQISLEALRATVEAGFLEMRTLMEARRVEEVRVAAELTRRLQKVEEQQSVQEAFFSFGKWIIACTTACAGAAVAFFLR